ncbi:hypothetical protein PENFLA_c082G09057 [Penicillium flavigenum]|uniref:Transcription factor domain-containing protein n=1 Tax=Penicillium flavigenum TaxID=254877 RepID=A0A1V6S9Y7_9EURO|nr:hypothetical protein PENFLA_c082G09057 [Penicillium flavigenum]
MSLMFMDEHEAGRAGLPLENTSELVQNWYDAALFFLNEAVFMRNPDFKKVQVIAILLSLARNVGNFDLVPVLQATGVRIGQILGWIMSVLQYPMTLLSKKPVGEPGKPWSSANGSLYQRVHIHETDFRVRLPLVLSDEELTTPLFDDPDMTVHKPLQMAAIEHISGENKIEDFVRTTDEALANIISQLPSHLLEVPGEPVMDKEHHPPWVLWQQTSLSLSLSFYRMKVNRVLQYQWASSLDVSLARSKAICLDSANAIVSMVKRHKVVLARHRPWPPTSALLSAALTIAAEAKRLDTQAAEEHIDRLQTCFSFFEYVKDHSALAIQLLGELRIFCAGLCCYDDSGTLDK